MSDHGEPHDWRTDLAAFRERHPRGDEQHEQAQESATGSVGFAGGAGVRVAGPAGSPSSCEGAAPSGAASVSEQDPDVAPSWDRAAARTAGSSGAEPSTTSRPSGSPSSIAARAREIEWTYGWSKSSPWTAEEALAETKSFAHSPRTIVAFATLARLLADEEMRRGHAHRWLVESHWTGLLRARCECGERIELEVERAAPPAAPRREPSTVEAIRSEVMEYARGVYRAARANLTVYDALPADVVAHFDRAMAMVGESVRDGQNTPPGSAGGGNTEDDAPMTEQEKADVWVKIKASGALDAPPASSALADVMALADKHALAWVCNGKMQADARAALEARVGELVTDLDDARDQVEARGFALDKERATIATLRAELERARADYDRMKLDRADALNVRSRDGLLSSEWIARTGKAERERDEARAELSECTRERDEARDSDRESLEIMRRVREERDSLRAQLAAAERERDEAREIIAQERASAGNAIFEAQACATPPPAAVPVESLRHIRERCHADYSGGHHEEPGISAFHQGMDTVCNVLEHLLEKHGGAK